MKRYRAELVAKIIGFMEITVEAENVEEAKRQALAEASKLEAHDWDIQEVEWYGDRGQFKEIEVNDIRELSET